MICSSYSERGEVGGKEGVGETERWREHSEGEMGEKVEW